MTTKFLVFFAVMQAVILNVSVSGANAAQPFELDGNGEGNTCQVNKLGWHFHCKTPKKKKKAKPNKPPAEIKPPVVKKTARQQLDQFNVELEEAKALAVINPSADNLKAYILLHQRALNMSSDFADSWRRVQWTNPELDYLNSHPISSTGKEVWKEERKTRQEDTAKNINERYGVFFFYLSTCPVCHRYGPILKDFAERFDVTIQAVRLDEGANLPSWPDSWVDGGQWDALGLTGQNVPMTVLFDKETKAVTPIGVGVMTHDELLNRIFVLTETEVGDVF